MKRIELDIQCSVGCRECIGVVPFNILSGTIPNIHTLKVLMVMVRIIEQEVVEMQGKRLITQHKVTYRVIFIIERPPWLIELIRELDPLV